MLLSFPLIIQSWLDKSLELDGIKVLFIKVKAGRKETSKNCCWTCSGRALSSPVAGGASRGSDD